MEVHPSSAGRWAYWLTAFLLLSQTATLMLFFVFVIQQRTPQIFSVYTPQKVLSGDVHLQGSVRVESTKCNLTSTDLLVGNTTAWVREQPTYMRIITNNIPVELGTTYAPGCQTRTFENKVPPDATLGTWHIEGSNRVCDRDGYCQDVAYHSESFEVVP